MSLKNTIVVFQLFISTLAFAQFPTNSAPVVMGGDGKISGMLIDSSTNAPIEFATLAIFKGTDLKKPIDGTITDEKGKFSIKELAFGKYTIRFSSIGYNDKMLKVAELTNKNKSVDMGSIVLNTNTKLLNEVVIKGQGAVIEEKVDRLVYNAEKDITSKGGDAADVLRKVPLLTVDLDGNVTLRGSSNIKVLIDNKPSTIIASSISDALKQIPADQIKTVEVITSPSSKYDAEGTSGIINIITKKNNIEGFQLRPDVAIGNRGGNLGLNGSLKAGKFGMTLGGFGRMNVNPSSTTFEQITKNAEKSFITKQSGDAKDQMVFGRYSLGMDYDITKTKSISAGARFGTRTFNRTQDLLIDRYLDQTLLSSTNQKIKSTGPSNSYDFNLDFVHVMKPQKEFSISTQYSVNTANSDFTNTPLGTAEAEKLAYTNRNNNKNQEITLQMDYQTPIKKNQILEMGTKGVFRDVNSDYKYLLGGADVLNDPKKPIGSLDYNQNIGAAYLSYTYATKNKYTFKGGTRYEVTDIGALQNQITKIDIPAYHILVPTFNVSKTYGGKYTVKAGYNRRIQRPGLQQLNPNRNLVNPQNITEGNPNLRPEIADNIEASVSASIKKIYLNMSVFSRNTDNSISQVSSPSSTDPGVLITTYQNIGKEKAYGVNLFGNLSLTSKWMLNGGIESFYNYFSGLTTGLDGASISVNNEGWNLNARLMSMITLKKGLQVQAFGFMKGSSVQAMGRQGGFGFYSLGIRKEFNKEKGTIGLSSQNFLSNSLKIRSTKESTYFTQNNLNEQFNRAISLNFSYKIGKMGANTFSRKKGKAVNNDDIKEGGEQQGGGQQGGGQQGGGQQGGGGRPQ